MVEVFAIMGENAVTVSGFWTKPLTVTSCVVSKNR
jgi:hypothetical protein